ncbi:hypothetical protein THAOC_34947 [Thalassiosira oceanica]|uniref:Uncharacterized protein n=1 Tax=Thalassiosira oceanica TaxID=159749 RepID=K0R2M6_THAOC|nr:hypothetical protein THAOC_34947 [Thalassiosira oceanica]|eukprot:EJK46385.1 hypothetical protein THAOC_34947 [Thalassiosira oceanica]
MEQHMITWRSVAIYGDAIVVGAYRDDDNGFNSGLANVFVRSGGVWTHQAKLSAPDGASGDYFGLSVTIYGDTVVVGAPLDNDNGFDSGSAHVFVRSGEEWTHQAKLLAPGGAAGDYFGLSVTIYGDTVVVGANGDGDNGFDSGSAHVFVQCGEGWTHQAKLLAPDGVTDDNFGYSVSIYGDAIVVGCFDSGYAHVFVRSREGWSHQAKLLAPGGAAGDYFGLSVAIYGVTVVVGAPLDNDNGFDSGSAHVFVRSGEEWTHQAKLLAPDGAADDKFGWSAAIYGDSVVVGADRDGDNGNESGSAHVFVV